MGSAEAHMLGPRVSAPPRQDDRSLRSHPGCGGTESHGPRESQGHLMGLALAKYVVLATLRTANSVAEWLVGRIPTDVELMERILILQAENEVLRAENRAARTRLLR